MKLFANKKCLTVLSFSLIRISDALDVLVKHKRINSEIAQEVMDFLKSNPASIPITKKDTDERTSKINEVSLLSYKEKFSERSGNLHTDRMKFETQRHSNKLYSSTYSILLPPSV